MPRHERMSSPNQRWRRGEDDERARARERERERERESQGENGTVHATGGVVATWRTRWVLTSRTNSDIRMPQVQTRGVTGELLPTDAASI
jgi:hypothetical protein